MKLLISTFVLVFSTTQAFGICTQPVTYLQETSPAPCSGYLFTPEKEQEVRTKITTYPKLEELIGKQGQLITTLNERIKVQQDLNDNLTQQLNMQQDVNKLQNTLWFVGGIIVTTAIIYGYKKASN